MAESVANISLNALSQQLAAAVETVGRVIVAVDARPRVRTSGVIWREGVLVSTNHTIRRDEDITVTSHDGREFPATLAGRDPATDIAVLRFESKEGASPDVVYETADVAALKVGHLVLAAGRAHPSRGVTASLGVLSVVGGEWRTWRGGEIDRLIRPDVSIFIGFSGGALLDTEGRIIGINTTGLARGAGLTIPAATVNRVVDSLLRQGRVTRPYLGVGMLHRVPLPEKLREKFNLPQASGLMLLSVEADGPSDKAGLIIGDILLTLGGRSIPDSDDAQALLGGLEVGAVVGAGILRGGEVKEVEITLGERPARRRRS
ncbi:MAG: trypsin-like peptidase domain-containing protein [Pyrinomonadaceae bacterium]